MRGEARFHRPGEQVRKEKFGKRPPRTGAIWLFNNEASADKAVQTLFKGENRNKLRAQIVHGSRYCQVDARWLDGADKDQWADRAARYSSDPVSECTRWSLISMPEMTMTAPKFELVLHSEARPTSQSVVLVFGTADKKKYALEFSATCIPLAIAAMAAEAGKIASTVPADKTPVLQPVRITGSTVAMRDDGNVALLLQLESGAVLPLEFQQTDLAKLIDQLQGVAALGDPKQRH